MGFWQGEVQVVFLLVCVGGAWLQLAKQPALWSRFGRTALFRGTQARIRSAEVAREHRSIYDILRQHDLCSQVMQAKSGAHFCTICERSFTAMQGWFLHASQKHGYISESSAVAQGQTCFCCAKVYLTTERLRHHLRYSASCRAYFRRHGQNLPVPPQALSQHPQFPWFKFSTETKQGLLDPARDLEVIRYRLQEAVILFHCPEQDDEFSIALFEALQEACRVAAPFQKICDVLHDWLKEFAETDQRIYQAGQKVLLWLKEFETHNNALHDPKEDDMIFADEEGRKRVSCTPGPPALRSFLPQELIMLHLFSGRRREKDIQMELEQLPLPPGVIMTVVSVDVAIDPHRCDLSQSHQQKIWYDLIKGGFVAGLYGGPPCESWSIARWEPAPETMRRSPRPLRCDPELWGLGNLSKREGQQVSIGNTLMLFCLKALLLQALTGGFAWLEHPANPHKRGTRHSKAPSIWMTQVVRWLHEARLVVFLDVLQGYFGADSPKPTTLMLAGVDYSRVAHCERSMRNSACAQGSNIGLKDGKWKTTHLKEYPPKFCSFGAALFKLWLDSLPNRTEEFLETTKWLRDLVLTFEDQRLQEPGPDYFARNS